MILYGKPVADAIDEITKEDAEDYLEIKRRPPILRVVRVGEDPGSISYEKGLIKKAEKLGIEVDPLFIPEGRGTEYVCDMIQGMNEDYNVDGILLLQPLPKTMDSEKIRNTIAPKKDVDCISDAALGNLFTHKSGFAPCTADACIAILDYYDIPISGKDVTIIGRSMVVGKPLASMMTKRNATVTLCHSMTQKHSLSVNLLWADIIISAVGKAKIIDLNSVDYNNTIIDVGINLDSNGKLCGDVDYDDVVNVVENITPVPGGVGNVTTSVLMKHVVEAYRR